MTDVRETTGRTERAQRVPRQKPVPASLVGWRMTGRTLLARPEGRALLAGPAPKFLDLIGTVADLITLVGAVGGSDTGPGFDIEDLLNEHSDLLEQILASQGDVLAGIGGISGIVGAIPGQVEGIKDLIAQIAQAQGEEQAALKEQLAGMLAEQRKANAQIRAGIAAVSGQVAGMWADMDAWFGTTLEQLNGIFNQLDVMGAQLRRIEALLQTVLAEIAELHDQLDWNAVITMMSEHEQRIAYGASSALDIPVTPRAPDAAGGRIASMASPWLPFFFDRRAVELWDDCDGAEGVMQGSVGDPSQLHAYGGALPPGAHDQQVGRGGPPDEYRARGALDGGASQPYLRVFLGCGLHALVKECHGPRLFAACDVTGQHHVVDRFMV